MNNTSRHVLAALGWLVSVPLILIPLFIAGWLQVSGARSLVVSVIWGAGLVPIFASWALRDAPAYGKSRNVALGFSAAWLVLFVFAVIPYLFVTRGLKGGLLTAIKFTCLCLAIAVVWVGAPRFLSGLF